MLSISRNYRFNWYHRRVKEVPTQMEALFDGLSRTAFIDRVARNAVGAAIKDTKTAETNLDAILEPFNRLQEKLRRDQGKVLDSFGAGEEWQEGEEISKDLRSVITELEDLVIHLLEGSLRDSYRSGALAFQNRAK
jgi:hypothetical protein